MLLISKLRPLLSRTFPATTRAFSANPLEKMPKLNEHGYELTKGAFRPEEIEDLRFVANSIFRLLGNERGNVASEEDYLYFSGGFPVRSDFRVIDVVGKTKCITGNGVNIMGQYMHEDVPRFREFAYSSIIKSIAKDVLKMKAPAIASMSYVFQLRSDWSNFRKDNSFIRTSPLSTKGILVSLSDVSEGEGFFVVPNSHMFPPGTFMRRIQEESSGDKKKTSKAVMIPSVSPQKWRNERVPLDRGDILAYDGNLSYAMYYFVSRKEAIT